MFTYAIKPFAISFNYTQSELLTMSWSDLFRSNQEIWNIISACHLQEYAVRVSGSNWKCQTRSNMQPIKVTMRVNQELVKNINL